MLKALLLRELKDAVDRILRGQCEMSLEEIEEAIRIFAHLPMSKAQAYEYLGISRSQFDTMIKNGQIPKGQKRVGFKELVWYKDELDRNKD